MKKITSILILSFLLLVYLSGQEEYKKYIPLIKKNISENYEGMFKEPGGAFKYPFITPGSDQYSDVLWDWDSWLTNVALRQVLHDFGSEKDRENAWKYETGCILNYLNYGGMNGWIPICIVRHSKPRIELMEESKIFKNNMHKPCLAQHAAFLVKQNQGEAEWLRENFYFLQAFVNAYSNHFKHHETGLYFWYNDHSIGVDNDPATFYRPEKSSGSIYLNCLMYKELLAMVYLANQLNLGEIAVDYQQEADELKENINKYCWDERDGFYYSVDLNLLPYHRPDYWEEMHIGGPRNYPCLIQRLDVWSGFLGLWAGLASTDQAERIVNEHFHDTTRFNAPFGIRTLSPLEKMYNVKASGNPSSWQGPVWGVSNYLVFSGLVRYGYVEEAKELAVKTIILFGRDLEKNGALHEYYLPSNGEPVLNKGFQNWNYLVINMIDWLESNEYIKEL
jgi:putative isomerase